MERDTALTDSAKYYERMRERLTSAQEFQIREWFDAACKGGALTTPGEQFFALMEEKWPGCQTVLGDPIVIDEYLREKKAMHRPLFTVVPASWIVTLYLRTFHAVSTMEVPPVLDILRSLDWLLRLTLRTNRIQADEWAQMIGVTIEPVAGYLLETAGPVEVGADDWVEFRKALSLGFILEEMPLVEEPGFLDPCNTVYCLEDAEAVAQDLLRDTLPFPNKKDPHTAVIVCQDPRSSGLIARAKKASDLRLPSVISEREQTKAKRLLLNTLLSAGGCTQSQVAQAWRALGLTRSKGENARRQVGRYRTGR